MRAWIRWCCCGWCRDCFDGKDGASDTQGLLPSRPSQDQLPLKESTYFPYDVRHISSVTTRAEMVESWLRACISGSVRKSQERSSCCRTPKRRAHIQEISSHEKLSTEYDGLSFDRAESRETLALGDGERSFVALGCGAQTSLSAPAFALVRGSQPYLGVEAASPSPAPTWCSGGEDSRKTPDPAVAWTAFVTHPSPSSIKDFGGKTHSISRSSLSSHCHTFALASPCEEVLARWRDSEGGCGDGTEGRRMRGGDDGRKGDEKDPRRSRSPWHATLSRFKLSPACSRSKSPLPDAGGGGTSGSRLHPLARLTPDLALSTPNLAKRSKEKVGGDSVLTLSLPSPSRMGASTSCLPRAVTAEVQSAQPSPIRNPFSIGGFSERWTESRSMESVNLESEPCSPAVDDFFQDGKTSSNLARSHGLDVSLYNLRQPRFFASSNRIDSLSTTPSNVPAIKVDSFENTVCHSVSNDNSYLSNYGFHWRNESYVEQTCGNITFAASYNQKNKKLCIDLERLENLPPRGKDSVYDVIVRLNLLPAEKHVKSTNIIRGSLSPEINESFSFTVKDPVGKIMRFSVFNSMCMGKHDAIGHACFNVEDVISGKPRKYSMKLTRQSQPSSSCGLLQVYFQLSHEQRLIVDAIQARNLCMASIPKANRSGDAFSTYVKVTFYCAGQKVKSKKSSVITCDRNPQYEFSNDFKIVPGYLDNCYVVLSVILKMSLRRDVTLGRYILGPNFFTGKQELTPWGRAILQHEQICHWFHLYL